MEAITARPAGIARCELGEGPLWCPDEGVLRFVDIDGGVLHGLSWAAREVSSRTFGRPVCCVVQSDGGSLLIALDNQIVQMGANGVETVAIGPFPEEVRFNDGKCDPAGRFFVGSTHREFREGYGALFRLDGTQLTPVLDGLGISNGLAWTSDSRSMFHVDTLTRRIGVYDYNAGTGTIEGLSHRIDVSDVPGVPDGMSIDSEDCIWVAFWGGASVVRFSREGQRLQTVNVAVPHVTSCAFAGPDLETLVITTANPGGLVATHAGDLFFARTGVPGASTPAWDGPSPPTEGP